MKKTINACLLAITCLAGTAQASNEHNYVYDFMGECQRGCRSTDNYAFAELVMSADYVPGTAVTANNFVSFWYENNTLFLGTNAAQHPVDFAISGLLPSNLNVAKKADFHIYFGAGTYHSRFGSGSDSYGTWSARNISPGLPGGQTVQLGRGGFWTLVSVPVPVTPPIPEPESYAMLLGGLALVGWMARRKQKA